MTSVEVPLTSRLDLETAQLRRLEQVSLIEATTLVLLVCVAVPLKHLAGWPAGVAVMGPIHGLAFLTYSWVAIQTVAGGGWRRAEAARLLLLAVIPFGGYFNLGLIRRKRIELGSTLAA
jgi:integral membrane protein